MATQSSLLFCSICEPTPPRFSYRGEPSHHKYSHSPEFNPQHKKHLPATVLILMLVDTRTVKIVVPITTLQLCTVLLPLLAHSISIPSSLPRQRDRHDPGGSCRAINPYLPCIQYINNTITSQPRTQGRDMTRNSFQVRYPCRRIKKPTWQSTWRARACTGTRPIFVPSSSAIVHCRARDDEAWIVRDRARDGGTGRGWYYSIGRGGRGAIGIEIEMDMGMIK